MVKVLLACLEDYSSHFQFPKIILSSTHGYLPPEDTNGLQQQLQELWYQHHHLDTHTAIFMTLTRDPKGDKD